MNPPESEQPAGVPGALVLLRPPEVLTVAVLGLAGALIARAPLFSIHTVLAAPAAGALCAAANAFSACFAANDARRRHTAPGQQETDDRGSRLLWRLAWSLLLSGIAAACGVGRDGATVAIGLALVALLPGVLPPTAWPGSAMCRGATYGFALLLGLCATSDGLGRCAGAALPIGAFAAGWAMLAVSRKPGMPPNVGFFALLHAAAALVFLISSATAAPGRGTVLYPLEAAPLLGVLVAIGYVPLVRAVMEPRRTHIRIALREGLVGIILFGATLAAAHTGAAAGLLVALFWFPLRSACREWPPLDADST